MKLFFLCFIFISTFAFGKNRSTACESGLNAFKTQLHPILRNNCATCHDTDSIGIPAPAHSVQDSGVSYISILPFIDFMAPMQSTIIKKFQTKHWEKWPVTTNISVTESELADALKNWWEMGQKSCPNAGKILSSPTALPMEMKVNEVSQLRWSLPNLPNAYFEMEVVALGENNVVDLFQLWKPRLVTPDKTLYVEGVHLLKNGEEVPGANNLSFVKATVNASKTPPVLSITTLLLLKRRDTLLQLSFDELKEATPKNCHSTDLFKKNLLPIYEKRDCYYCHGGGPKKEVGMEKAKARFSMDLASEEELCNSSLQRANGKRIDQTPLIALPLDRANGHEWILPRPSEIFPNWSEWIRSEQ